MEFVDASPEEKWTEEPLGNKYKLQAMGSEIVQVICVLQCLDQDIIGGQLCAMGNLGSPTSSGHSAKRLRLYVHMDCSQCRFCRSLNFPMMFLATHNICRLGMHELHMLAFTRVTLYTSLFLSRCAEI